MRAIVYPVPVPRAPLLVLLGFMLVGGCSKSTSTVAPAPRAPQGIPNPPFVRPPRAYPLRHLVPSWGYRSRIAYFETGLLRVENGREVYADSIQGIWLLDTSTGESQLLLPARLPSVSSAWSPDGTRLVYSDQTNLIALDVASGQSIQLTNFQCPASATHPKWSPDGSTIAFTYTPPDGGWPGSGVWTVGADGSTPKQIALGYINPDWHPEGLVMRDPAGFGIYLWRRATDQVVRLQKITGFQAGDLAVSPDGSRIAISAFEWGSLWLMNADGSDFHAIADHVYTGHTWSPDGRFVVFTRYDDTEDVPANGVLWQVNVSTGELTQLTHH